jgi:photosystem II stability/assembly factor-like uncharacterized protein
MNRLLTTVAAVGLAAAVLVAASPASAQERKISRFYSAWFVSPQIGFALADIENGDVDVMQTADGGQSWKPVYSFRGSSDLGWMYFFDQKRGWIVGQKKLWMTTNGGKNWGKFDIPREFELKKLRFISASKGYVIGSPPYGSGGPTVLVTTNAGQVWTPDKYQPGSVQDYAVVDEANVWMVDETGASVSIDKGKTWTRKLEKQGLVAVSFSDKGHGAVSAGNAVSCTADGGATWKDVTVAGAQPFTQLFFVDATTGFAWAEGQLYGTKDACATWTKLQDPHGPPWFFDASTGWAQDLSGTMWWTADGGATFQSREAK